jgi:hypothetical protein
VLVTINNEYCYRERGLLGFACFYMRPDLLRGLPASINRILEIVNFFTLFVNKMSVFEYCHMFWEAHTFFAASVNKTMSPKINLVVVQVRQPV